MPLYLVRNDITKMKVDAIVNAANGTLLGGGGVDGAIHRAAGPELLAECRTLNGCETGGARITGAYRLPCQYVIHTVGPVWHGGFFGERGKLISCYRTSLSIALEHHCETVAFPLISAGAYGYPRDKALRVAVDTISGFLFDHEMTVYLVIFDMDSFRIGSRLFQSITSYIDDNYAAEHADAPGLQRSRLLQQEKQSAPREARAPHSAAFSPRLRDPSLSGTTSAFPGKALRPGRPAPDGTAAMQDHAAAPSAPSPAKAAAAGVSPSLEDALQQIDESFSEMLLRKIDERGITDVQCYKKANINRKLFSKIRSDRLYRPSKSTVLAFAIALELTLDETKDMLMKAGFALSHSSRFDIIVEYFISRGIYDVFEINEALFAFDQNLLGA